MVSHEETTVGEPSDYSKEAVYEDRVCGRLSPGLRGGRPRRGRMSASSAPGLGVVPDPAVLGEAVFTVR